MALNTPLMAEQRLSVNEQATLPELIEQISHTHLLDDELFHKLVQLDAAYCQLELGLYGLCADCEMEIEPERLAADPTEQRCAVCGEKHLREHRQELRLNH
ncbi:MULTISPECIES: TraR/DksA C4-type zinc finger protein [Shewanella]|nr:TraR/DksA C4-type zinc finger protein [Shewanella sp. WXL01]